MAVLPSSRDVVVHNIDQPKLGLLFGKKSLSASMRRLIFGEKWIEGIENTCSHFGSYMARIIGTTFTLLGVEVKGRELLAVSCSHCRDIKLVDLQTGEKSVAYRYKDKQKPEAMCEGEPGRLWVLENGAVIELNCTDKVFCETGDVFNANLVCYVRSICYLAAPHDVLVVSTYDHVRAYRRSGKPVWKMPSHHEDVKVDPEGLAFSVQHQVLLLADGKNRRLLQLDPRDGSILRSFPLQKLSPVFKNHVPYRLSWSGDHLVVLADYSRLFSFFSEVDVCLWFKVFIQ